MASMRTLRRRLLRWQRYDARAAKLVPVLVDRGLRRGHYRAAKAVDAENERRFWAETPEIWLGGPEGEQALIADVLSDGPYSHLTGQAWVDAVAPAWLGPDRITNEQRRQAKHRDACWDGCDDLHDDPCEVCESSDCLGDCWDDGASWSEPAEAWVVTGYGFAERGLL